MKASIIFNEIQGLNPKTSIISSIGSFISNENQMVSDMIRKEAISNVSESSLAFSILRDSEKFSEKQLWVISFELLKNESYCKNLQKTVDERNKYMAFQKARKYAKKEAVKTVKAELKAEKTERINTCHSLTDNQKIKHASFGIGQVLDQDEKTITVLFETVGKKRLLKAFVKLETL